MYFNPVSLHEVDDLLALVERGGHRHGAGDVFAGLERLDRLAAVIGNRRVDVNGMDVRIREQVLVGSVAFRDAELVADFIQLGLGPLADGIHVRIRMTLIDRDELGAETEADDGDVDL